MDNISIKDNIRRLRKERRLTQENMAYQLGISLTAYRDLERGSTSIMNENIVRLAELFSTSTEEIVLGYMPSQKTDKTLEEMKNEYQGQVNILEKRIEYLEKLVRSLEETIETKNEIIRMLKK